MDCTQARELMSAFYDCELEDNLRAQVQQHLEACEECQHEIAGFRRLSDLASARSTPPPSSDLWSKSKTD